MALFPHPWCGLGAFQPGSSLPSAIFFSFLLIPTPQPLPDLGPPVSALMFDPGLPPGVAMASLLPSEAFLTLHPWWSSPNTCLVTFFVPTDTQGMAKYPEYGPSHLGLVVG